MKTTLIFGGAISALMLAVAAPSFAAPTPPAPPAPPSASQPGPGGDRMGPRMGRMGPGMRMGRMQRATPEERAKRRAEQFARMDTNRDGRVTEPEFRTYLEARKREREHRAFLRFSGDQESVTLDQLNARALQREQQMRERFQNRGPRGGRDGGRPMGGFDGRDFDRPAPPAPPARPNL